MAITTLDGLIGSAKQRIPMNKFGTLTTVAAQWFSPFAISGNPGAGVLAGTSTTTGVVPTDATAGCPTINVFAGGATGYLAGVQASSTVLTRLRLADMLWKGGAYTFNQTTTGQTPTSYSSRVPSGTDFTGTQIWLEQVTAGTGVQNVAVTYINQAGTTGRSTGTVATAVNIVGRMWRLPLQAGDTGVQGITGVVGSTASAGTFNILVLRPLWSCRVRFINDGLSDSIEETGMPVVFADSALIMQVATDSTALGVPEMDITIVNG
jgi:hypothetical protein